MLYPTHYVNLSFPQPEDYFRSLNKIAGADTNKHLMIDAQGKVYYASKLRQIWERFKGFIGRTDRTNPEQLTYRTLCLLDYGMRRTSCLQTTDNRIEQIKNVLLARLDLNGRTEIENIFERIVQPHSPEERPLNSEYFRNHQFTLEPTRFSLKNCLKKLFWKTRPYSAGSIPVNSENGGRILETMNFDTPVNNEIQEVARVNNSPTTNPLSPLPIFYVKNKESYPVVYDLLQKEYPNAIFVENLDETTLDKCKTSSPQPHLLFYVDRIDDNLNSSDITEFCNEIGDKIDNNLVYLICTKQDYGFKEQLPNIRKGPLTTNANVLLLNFNGQFGEQKVEEEHKKTFLSELKQNYGIGNRQAPRPITLAEAPVSPVAALPLSNNISSSATQIDIVREAQTVSPIEDNSLSSIVPTPIFYIKDKEGCQALYNLLVEKYPRASFVDTLEESTLDKCKNSAEQAHLLFYVERFDERFDDFNGLVNKCNAVGNKIDHNLVYFVYLYNVRGSHTDLEAEKLKGIERSALTAKGNILYVDCFSLNGPKFIKEEDKKRIINQMKQNYGF